MAEPAVPRSRAVLRIEIERETDGRWIAEVTDLPGALAYGSSAEEARMRVTALALRILADRVEHGEAAPEVTRFFSAA